MVRIRPAKGLGIGDTSVTKVSKDSLSVDERKYTFDSVFDSDSTQVGIIYSLQDLAFRTAMLWTRIQGLPLLWFA